MYKEYSLYNQPENRQSINNRQNIQNTYNIQNRYNTQNIQNTNRQNTYNTQNIQNIQNTNRQNTYNTQKTNRQNNNIYKPFSQNVDSYNINDNNNFVNQLSHYPEHTKMTRCENNLRADNNQIDFLRPMITNQSVPIMNNHENYLYDNNNIPPNTFDIERCGISTRTEISNSRKPVQMQFQNDYYINNFDTLNNMVDIEQNKYLTRNPVNTRRDALEKERNNDKNDFMAIQGGVMSNNFGELSGSATRKGRTEINSSSYIPMARTLAIPKENI